MEGFSYVDLFATKGIEYLLVIGFLLALIVYWRYLNRTEKAAVPAPAGAGVSRAGWFQLQKGLYYHQGHTWAQPEEDNVVKVGIDDFAQKFLGKPEAFDMPKPGTRITQGENAWKLLVDSKPIDMLSPVNGEVISVNESVIQNPDLLSQDPYNNGWLVKVKVDKLNSNLKNLLSGRVAVAWMENTVNLLRSKMSGELGMVLQDGGFPVAGFAKELSPDSWEDVAAEFFMSK